MRWESNLYGWNQMDIIQKRKWKHRKENLFFIQKNRRTFQWRKQYEDKRRI